MEKERKNRIQRDKARRDRDTSERKQQPRPAERANVRDREEAAQREAGKKKEKPWIEGRERRAN